MGAGVGLVLIALGAILRFATTTSVTGFNIHTVGVILMVVGLIALVLSFFYWSSWGGYGISRQRTIVRSGTYDGGYAAGGPYPGPGSSVATRVDEEQRF
jgi:hypothetical protein